MYPKELLEKCNAKRITTPKCNPRNRSRTVISMPKLLRALAHMMALGTCKQFVHVRRKISSAPWNEPISRGQIAGSLRKWSISMRRSQVDLPKRYFGRSVITRKRDCATTPVHGLARARQIIAPGKSLSRYYSFRFFESLFTAFCTHAIARVKMFRRSWGFRGLFGSKKLEKSVLRQYQPWTRVSWFQTFSYGDFTRFLHSLFHVFKFLLKSSTGTVARKFRFNVPIQSISKFCYDSRKREEQLQ